MLHTVGDSHCNFSFGGIPNVKYHHLGPITMFRVGRDGKKILDISGSSVPHGSRVICCFGEIDVRCHLARHYCPDAFYTSDTEPIRLLVTNYMKTLVANKEHHTICVMSVIPPCYSERMVHNPEFPVRGSDEQRLRYNFELNNELKLQAELNGIDFLNISDLYADEKGMLNPALSDDGVHISNSKPMHNRLIELGWLN